ncbi:MAG: 7-cyano-7-deazaguanine synthase [Phycisphaerales bacterium]|jgi:7-cyano-7-deazaguanine synthase
MATKTNNRPAVVLLSGGLDSATVLAIAQRDGFACHALAFDYGQRHKFELEAAAAVAAKAGVDLKILSLDFRAIGGSALTDDIDVPKAEAGSDTPPTAAGIPITYVPARNLAFLSIALGYAEVLGAGVGGAIYLGVNAVDYSGYPDCRPEFIESFQHTANLATKAGVEASEAGAQEPAFKIVAPLMDLTKAQIITLGVSLGVDYALTHSCYDPDATDGGAGRACGRCDSCVLRRQGFEAAGVADPTRYA